jgi:DNA-binding response OmpR family regulator
MPNKRILWIENQLEYASPHLIALRRAGFTIDTVTSAEEGIQSLRTDGQSYDLILLDILMGEAPLEGKHIKNGRTGLIVYEIIRNNLKLKTPIIFMTVLDDVDIKVIKSIRQTENSLGHKYLVLHKPVRPSELLQTVRAVIGHSLSQGR